MVVGRTVPRDFTSTGRGTTPQGARSAPCSGVPTRPRLDATCWNIRCDCLDAATFLGGVIGVLSIHSTQRSRTDLTAILSYCLNNCTFLSSFGLTACFIAQSRKLRHTPAAVMRRPLALAAFVLLSLASAPCDAQSSVHRPRPSAPSSADGQTLTQDDSAARWSFRPTAWRPSWPSKHTPTHLLPC